MPQIYKQAELTDSQIKELGESLKEGSIGVFLSDTVYGIFTSALKSFSVEKIYRLRKRTPTKPMIILLSSISSLMEFPVRLDYKTKIFLEKIWPGPVSVVLPCLNTEMQYLLRGGNSLAFRIPKNELLRKILKVSGPLVAPSANLEGEVVSKNIEEASQYFQDQVDFYIDGGTAELAKASTVIRIMDNRVEVLREGEVKIKELNI